MTLGHGAERKHFAAGDFVTRYTPGASFELRIDSGFEKPGWQPRAQSPVGQTTFPGTAILFQDRYFEVIHKSIEELPDRRVCYYLKPWDDRFPIRVQFPYTPEECRKTARLFHQTVRQNQNRFLINCFLPLVGMLPGEDQTRIANRYGISSTRLTLLSSILLFIPSAFAILFVIAHRLGAEYPGPSFLHDFYVLGFYFAPESMIRMITSAKLEEPMGSLPVTLPLSLIRSLDKEKQARPLDPLCSTDRIRHLPGEAPTLEIVSLFPKAHWNRTTAVNFNGVMYGLIQSEQFRDREKILHRFVLEVPAEGTWFRSVVHYSPDEAYQHYLKQRRRDLGTWVDTFSPFWGLLDGRDQKTLSELYGFSALKYSGWTIIGLGLLSFFNLIASISNLSAGIGTRLDVLLLPLSIYFLLETMVRGKKWSAGEPSGSALGLLIQPFASRLLRGK